MRQDWRRHSMLPLRNRRTALVLLTALATLAGLAGSALARESDARARLKAPFPGYLDVSARAPTRGETLWIFDADFEDLLGDNAGWTSFDRSGTLAVANHWHKDTIRINGFTHLGDSTWWCGTYNDCWRQPRGYGNNWYQLLEREFPEVAAFSEPGDELMLEYDQRIAMENNYDYGYLDISDDGGDNYTTLEVVSNPGFAGTPGISLDWDSMNPKAYGHMVVDISDYAGQLISLRFRFESDSAYSSQDQHNNPPHNSVKDGAWQLDNITLFCNDAPIFLDDCESPGSAGWIHDNVPAHGQTGVTFWRGLYGTDIWTNRPFACNAESGWMYAAVDPTTSRMVDGEFAWLMSPPIDVSGASSLVGQWDMWIDMPRASNDIFNLYLASSPNDTCVQDDAGFCDEEPGWWYGGPYWKSIADDWSAFAGNDWLSLMWAVMNDEPPSGGEVHWGGVFLDRQRVGVPTGDFGTVFERDIWNSFNDWFIEQMPDALLDTMYVGVQDDDGIISVTLMASNDGGQTWDAYACRHESPSSKWWYAPPPVNQMTQGSEIRYYFEAVDGVGVTSVFPEDAPDDHYEISILPATGSVSGPGILLVDKHGQRMPGEDRHYDETSERFYREALDILGYEYDVYDVEVPGGSIKSDGPDTCGMKYYDTQIWFTSSETAYLIIPADQGRLAQWLEEASGGKERNLLVAGNNAVRELCADSLGFLATYLATEFISDTVGDATVDSIPTVRDAAGDFDFMTFDDRKCVLRGGCPELIHFDVVQPLAGASGAELAAEYLKADVTARPAGVAYTDASGYQTVTLGFGIEFMSDAPMPSGHFLPGASDRVDLIANIMEYFAKEPTGPGTGTEHGEVLITRLEPARPNPFNPRTSVAFTLANAGRATVRVFDASGRLVVTLHDADLTAGPHDVTWDGTNARGEPVASGVYFVRLETEDGTEGTGKLVFLK